jgi:hypothetical protein
MKVYPPFLDEVIEHCPKAAALYTKLWRERNSENSVIYLKEDIIEYSPLKKFKNDLLLLKNEKVLNYKFSLKENKITIHLNEQLSRTQENVA